MHMQAMVYKGQREHTAKVYLRPIMHRPNLHVLTHAKVTRVIFYSFSIMIAIR